MLAMRSHAGWNDDSSVMKKNILILIVFTVLVFALQQGLRLSADDGWSWPYLIAFGIALSFQLVALWQSRSES